MIGFLPKPALLLPRTQLFRSLKDAELHSIQQRGRFSNPSGISVKYFAETFDDARRYAVLANEAYDDGPYHVVETSFPTSLIRSFDRIVADGGIRTVVVRTALLIELSSPTILP